MPTIKFRVFDKIRNRYGKITSVRFFHNFVVYEISDADGNPPTDEHGEPTELGCTDVAFSDCVIEAELNGVWTPVNVVAG